MMTAPNRPFDAVIFDMDGTLIEPLLDFRAIRAELDIPADEGILEALTHRPTEERQWAHTRLMEHEVSAARQAKLLPGAEDIVSVVRSAGLKTALLTRNTREAANLVLANHPVLQFDLVVCREDGPAKPDAQAVLNICETLGITPARTLCVGDFHYDILAANAAGATSVLLTTLRDRPDFAEWSGEADYRIDRLDEMLSILEL